jgi:lysozyme
MIRGLDVSAAQGHVDWPSVAAMGCRFAILKCAEGNRGKDPIFDLAGFDVTHERAANTSGQDPQFLTNLTGAKAAGLVVGCYSFAYPLPPKPGVVLHEPEDQAKFHYDLAGGLGSSDGELPPAFDFEWPAPNDWAKWGCSAGQLRAWALAYLEAAKAYWGCAPLVYTYPDFWMHVGGSSEPAFAQYPLWMASYPHATQWPTDGNRPLIVRPWTDWAAWQWTGGAAKLPNGVAADFDVIRDEDTLHALTHS